MKKNRKKYLLGMVLIMVGTVIMSGCSKKKSSENIDDRPKITIGCDDYAPFSYMDVNGNVTGIDVELATEAFDRMGYQVEIEFINWEEKKDLLANGSIDCIWSSFTMDGREDEYKWAGPYMKSNQVIAVNVDSDVTSIFLNVYDNCVKYNKVGGKIRTSLECLGIENQIVTYRWTITDTGVGMNEEFVEHVFDSFVQEHSDARTVYNGVGLGMSIVKKIIDKMGGTIEVTSKEGKGSTFVITLPFEIVEKEVEEEPGTREQDNLEIAGLHLLLVEDNELNAEIARTLLEDEGVAVEAVTNGKEAVDTFVQNPEGTFDVILMDVMMPVMDGIKATEKIRSLNRPDATKIPIIAMTANAFKEDAQKCLDAGMNAHLSKPLQMDKVVETIAYFCKR